MIIKLTHVSGIAMYVNSDNIVQFFTHSGLAHTTLIMVGCEDNVKESPEDICAMLGAVV